MGEISIRKEYFNLLAENWDHETTKNNEFIKIVLDLLPGFNEPRILDVGAGTGVMVPFLLDKYNNSAKIIELDYAKKMIKQSRLKYAKYQNINFVVEDIYDYDYSYLFDIIICYSVFPHLPDKKRVLKKLSQGITSEGKLVIFHSDSREKINLVHEKQVNTPVVDDILPPAVNVSKIAREVNLKTEYFKDDQEGYVLVFSK